MQQLMEAKQNKFQAGSNLKDIGFNLHDTMIFQKTNPIPQIYRKRYNGIFEYVCF